MELSKRRLAPWFLLALLVVIGWASFRIVGIFLDYILLALFLAYITYPVYTWFLKWLKKPMLASLTTLVIGTAVVLVPLGFILVELIDEMRNLLLALDVGAFQATLDSWGARFDAFVGREPGGPTFVDTLLPTVTEFFRALVANSITAVAEGIIGAFVLLYVLYYAYVDGPRLVAFFHDILPMQEAHRDLMFHEVGLVVRAVVMGQFMTSLIQAIVGGIGYFIFGVPNVVFWATVTFIFALLPVIGTPVVWLPWAIYLFSAGHTFEAVGLLIYGIVVISSIDNIIRPKLIGDRAHVHPVLVLLGVLGGVVVFGFAGFLLGPLVLSVFVTVLNVYRKEFANPLSHET